jgi:energy-coupling factor transporter transmembrane protein EcfT
MAVISSAILAISTSTENLAKAFSWFVKPFQWLGCPTGEWQKLLLLTMDFLPVIQEEILATRREDDERSNASSSPGRQGRWHRWLQKLNGLLLRLVERGDAIAHRLAGDEDPVNRPADLLPLFPMTLTDQVFSGAMMATMICYWLLG